MSTGSGIPIANKAIRPTVTQSGANSARREMGGISSFGSLLVGIVRRVDPCNNEIDVALFNGGIMHNVPVVQSFAGTTEGVYGLPNIKTPKKNEQNNQQQGQTQQQAGSQDGSTQTGNNPQGEKDDSDGRVDWKDIKDAEMYKPEYERDTWAIVGFVNSTSRTPVCLGFFYPHSTQMSIKGRQENKEDRIDYLHRLTSGEYQLHTRGGVAEYDYPDGTHVRVGKPHKKDDSQQSGTSQQDAGSQDGSTQTQQTSSSSQSDYYDDDADDPDARIVLGEGQYENKDKDDKKWDIAKESDPFRYFIVHSSKTKWGIDENGRIHHQYYKNKDQESTAPDSSGDDGENKFNHAHTDLHQTRMWRMGFGDPKDEPGPEDKVIDGEDWYDPTNKRNRFHLPEVSDGQYHQCNCGSGSGGSAGGGGSPTGMSPLGGFGAGSGFMQQGSYGVENFPVHQGEKYFTNQVGQTGGLYTDSNGKYFPAATTDGHAVSIAQVHHDGSPYAVDILTGPNGRFIAPTSGYVTSMPVGGAGNLVTLHGDDGFDYSGGHVSALASGRVTAGTAIGAVAPLGSTSTFTGGLSDGLHIHYLVTGRGQPPSPDGGGTIQPYYGTSGVAGLSATVDAHGGTNGSPPGTVGAVVDPTGQESNPTIGEDPEATSSTQGQGGEDNQQTKWYMPAATPKGGGVAGKLRGIKAKPTDQSTTDAGATGSGSATGDPQQEDRGKESEDGSKSKDGILIDSAAEDHEHYAFVADDSEIKSVSSTDNKGGTSDNLARGDHEHKDEDSSSDERLKNNLGVIQEVLPALRELTVIRYTWNELAEINDPEEQIGLIAQEVNQNFPELIRYDSKGYMHLNYKKLAAVLVKGLQETNSRIDRIEQMLGMNNA